MWLFQCRKRKALKYSLCVILRYFLGVPWNDDDYDDNDNSNNDDDDDDDDDNFPSFVNVKSWAGHIMRLCGPLVCENIAK